MKNLSLQHFYSYHLENVFTMYKSEIVSMPEYFDRYISLTPDTSILDALHLSLDALENAPINTWFALGDKTYAPEKWTVKDILQHCIDAERIFEYRILSIARGEQQRLLSFDEEAFGVLAQAHLRHVDSLFEEWILVRKSLIKMFETFTDEMLLRQGTAYNGIQYGPLALGYVVAGHQKWHFNILEERYYPLLQTNTH